MSWATQGYRPAKGWRKHIRRIKAKERREAWFKEAEEIRLKRRAEERQKKVEAALAAEWERRERQREADRERSKQQTVIPNPMPRRSGITFGWSI